MNSVDHLIIGFSVCHVYPLFASLSVVIWIPYLFYFVWFAFVYFLSLILYDFIWFNLKLFGLDLLCLAWFNWFEFDWTNSM